MDIPQLSRVMFIKDSELLKTRSGWEPVLEGLQNPIPRSPFADDVAIDQSYYTFYRVHGGFTNMAFESIVDMYTRKRYLF